MEDKKIDYYSKFLSDNPYYSTVYPNDDELSRGTEILKLIERIRQEFALKKTNPNILDLGCGRGWLTYLMSIFGNCLGIDPSKGQIIFAKKNYPGVNYMCCTLKDLLSQSTSSKFNIIVTSEVIEHIPKQNQREFILQIRNSLKPEGYCIITTPRGELENAYWKAKIERQSTERQPVEDWITEKELNTLFKECGFIAVRKSRAYPLRITKRDKILYSNLFRFFKMFLLYPCFDYLSSIYQVWLFKLKK